MNNPNPFVPQGSLQEQQNQRRKHVKIGVLCVLTVSVASLMVMLIQGCKQKPNPDESATASVDTNSIPVPDTNVPPVDVSNQPPVTPSSNLVSVPSPTTSTLTPGSNVPPVTSPLPPVAAPLPTTQPEAPAGGEYVVAKGDSLAKIAKKNGVTLKALTAANPGLNPKKLKIGQKLVLPAGGKSTVDGAAAPAAAATAEPESESYTVKSGDTLTKIAKAHHVKLKELQAANGLTTTKIKVGEKLKIPAKGEAAPVTPGTVTPPAVDITPAPATPAPALPSVTAPAPATPAVPGSH